MRRRAPWLVVLVLFAVAAPASGHVPMTLDFLGGTAVLAHWPAAGFPVTMEVSRGLTSDVADGDRAALESAMATWSSVADSTAALSLAGEADVEAGVLDGRNVIEFSDSAELDGAGFIALTFLLTEEDGTITEADVLVNDRAVGFATDGGSVGLDLETFLLHELGEVLGLDHSPTGRLAPDGSVEPASAIRFPVNRGVGVVARDLVQDDIAGIADLYPAPGSSRGAITGRITREGAAVFGAHVVAFDPAQNITVGAVSLPDGSYRIGGLPPGRYLVRVLPLAAPAGPTALRGIFPAGDVDTDFNSAFVERAIRVAAGATVAGVDAEVQ